MFPAASPAGVVVKSAQPVTSQAALRNIMPQAPETTRASAGETAAANVRAESAQAIEASDQTAVAPRLRDQETAERTCREQPARDTPTGPPPAFEESPLERQARVALDLPADDTPPPPVAREPEQARPADGTRSDVRTSEPEKEPAEDRIDPPPSPTERAEASFAETRTMAGPREPARFDLSS